MDFNASAFIVFAFLTLVVNVFGRCPPVNQVRGPQCREDYDCRKGICCPNWLGKKSCVTNVPFKADRIDAGRYENAGKQKFGTGVYCDGVKCMPYQVCKPDRVTGKLRCQSP